MTDDKPKPCKPQKPFPRKVLDEAVKKKVHGQFTPRILAGQFGNVLDHEGKPIGEWRGPKELMPKPREGK